MSVNELSGNPFIPCCTVAEPRCVIIAGDMLDVVDDMSHWECDRCSFDPERRPPVELQDL